MQKKNKYFSNADVNKLSEWIEESRSVNELYVRWDVCGCTYNFFLSPINNVHITKCFMISSHSILFYTLLFFFVCWIASRSKCVIAENYPQNAREGGKGNFIIYTAHHLVYHLPSFLIWDAKKKVFLPTFFIHF